MKKKIKHSVSFSFHSRIYGWTLFSLICFGRLFVIAETHVLREVQNVSGSCVSLVEPCREDYEEELETLMVEKFQIIQRKAA